MMHSADGHDVLALSMFWTGLLMVFAPLIFAGTIIGVAWKARRQSDSRTIGRSDGRANGAPD